VEAGGLELETGGTWLVADETGVDEAAGIVGEDVGATPVTTGTVTEDAGTEAVGFGAVALGLKPVLSGPKITVVFAVAVAVDVGGLLELVAVADCEADPTGALSVADGSSEGSAGINLYELSPEQAPQLTVANNGQSMAPDLPQTPRTGPLREDLYFSITHPKTLERLHFYANGSNVSACGVGPTAVPTTHFPRVSLTGFRTTGCEKRAGGSRCTTANG
jgi:hypothetical protein